MIYNFIVGAIMALIVTLTGRIYRRIKNGYIPPGPAGEDYSNTIIYSPCRESDAMPMLESWGADSHASRRILSAFTDLYMYWARADECFKVIGTLASAENNVYIVVRKTTHKKKNTPKTENDITLTKDARLIAGSAVLRENLEGVTWKISDITGMKQIFILDNEMTQ